MSELYRYQSGILSLKSMGPSVCMQPRNDSDSDTHGRLGPVKAS